MIKAFRWCVANDPWDQCERRGLNFLVRARSAARLLGGSAGSAGCQLTGPVAETPDVDLRRSAASHHQAELGGRCPREAEANPGVWSKKKTRKKSYYRKPRPRPGVWGVVSSLRNQRPDLQGRPNCKGVAICSANRANSIFNRLFRAFAHPKMRKVGAWGLRRPRALTTMFSLFWRRPPKKREKGDFV